jgi:hypothetical protein
LGGSVDDIDWRKRDPVGPGDPRPRHRKAELEDALGRALKTPWGGQFSPAARGQNPSHRVSILKMEVVGPPFEPRLQQIYADSSHETVQHQKDQGKHRSRPLSVH